MRVFNGYWVKALYNNGTIREEWYNAPNPDDILRRIASDVKRRLLPVREIKILSVRQEEMVI